jgi:DNA-binding NarL/FixJ family response regulator
VNLRLQSASVRVATDSSASAPTWNAALARGPRWHFQRVLIVGCGDHFRRRLLDFVKRLGSDPRGERMAAAAARQLGCAPELVIADQSVCAGDGRSFVDLASQLSCRPFVVAIIPESSAGPTVQDLPPSGERLRLHAPISPQELVRRVELELAEIGMSHRSGELSLSLHLALFADRYGVPNKEMDLVRLAVAGLSSQQCAAQLGVSDNTRKTLVRRLLIRCRERGADGARCLADVPRLVLMCVPQNDGAARSEH